MIFPEAEYFTAAEADAVDAQEAIAAAS